MFVAVEYAAVEGTRRGGQKRGSFFEMDPDCRLKDPIFLPMHVEFWFRLGRKEDFDSTFC